MVLDGYDHVIDVTDADGSTIAELARARGHPELADYLDSVVDFVEVREQLLSAIRHDELRKVQEILARPDAVKLARARNYYGEQIISHVTERILNFVSILFCLPPTRQVDVVSISQR